ncbi:MAG TPA: TetR/AcrR family transcriptional regulator [Devosia sp.]|nr:TetR/AcrR family transcriptional regulator [Devosia sp.]
MAKKENSAKTPPTREKILGTAFELFIQHGYEGTSLNKIVGQSGVSKGAFYHYFPSKFDLYQETINRFFLLPFEKFDISGLAKLSPKKARAALRAHYASLGEQMTGSSGQNMGPVLALMFDSFTRLPKFHKKTAAIYASLIKNLARSFAKPDKPDRRIKRRARKFIAQLEGEILLRTIQNIPE